MTCGKIECPNDCQFLPALQEFEEWRARTKARQPDPTWCPTVWEGEGYEGWINFETWRAFVQIDNDPDNSRKLEPVRVAKRLGPEQVCEALRRAFPGLGDGVAWDEIARRIN